MSEDKERISAWWPKMVAGLAAWGLIPVLGVISFSLNS
jgi:hypothetical protein